MRCSSWRIRISRSSTRACVVRPKSRKAPCRDESALFTADLASSRLRATSLVDHVPAFVAAQLAAPHELFHQLLDAVLGEGRRPHPDQEGPFDQVPDTLTAASGFSTPWMSVVNHSILLSDETCTRITFLVAAWRSSLSSDFCETRPAWAWAVGAALGAAARALARRRLAAAPAQAAVATTGESRSTCTTPSSRVTPAPAPASDETLAVARLPLLPQDHQRGGHEEGGVGPGEHPDGQGEREVLERRTTEDEDGEQRQEERDGRVDRPDHRLRGSTGRPCRRTSLSS